MLTAFAGSDAEGAAALAAAHATRARQVLLARMRENIAASRPDVAPLRQADKAGKADKARRKTTA